MGPTAFQISRYRPYSPGRAPTDGILAEFRTPRMDGLRGPDRAGQNGRDYPTMKYLAVARLSTLLFAVGFTLSVITTFLRRVQPWGCNRSYDIGSGILMLRA